MNRNPDQIKCIKIDADGLTTEISQRQYDEETAYRNYSGSALFLPQHWEHKRYTLTMAMLVSMRE